MEKYNTGVYSPINGVLHDLSESTDPLFKEKIMGGGFLIKPSESNVRSPISGVIKSVFPTFHAFGIVDSHGTEILVHIGVNTFEIENGSISSDIRKGNHVKAGDVIAKVDFDVLRSKGYSDEVLVIALNKPVNIIFKEKEVVTQELIMML